MSLTTLSAVKTLLGISASTYDTVLQNLIDAVSVAITNYCDRDSFEDADYTELINARNFKLILRNKPINKIYYVGIDYTNAIKVTYTGTSVASIQVFTDKVIVSDNFVSTELTYATYPTITLLSTAIGNIANFDTVLVKGGPSKILISGVINLEQNDEKYIERVDESVDIGEIYNGFYSTESQYPHLVIYNGGYVTIPQDIIEICNQAVMKLYFLVVQKKSIGDIDSQTIGDYSYTTKDTSTTNQANINVFVANEFGKALIYYKNPVI